MRLEYPEGFAFDEATHAYTIQGVRVPGVTSVLEPYSGMQYVDPQVKDAAAELGHHVHLATHLYDLEQLDETTVDPELSGYLRAWTLFLDETGAVVLDTEVRVVSKRHGFAGTFDKRVAWGRTNRLIDVKSTASVPRTVGPQTAGYAEAWWELTGERLRDRYCVRLAHDGRYTLHPLRDPRDWEIFKSALVIHNWLKS